ncbi:MAG: 50S ribosomal protein L10, partial [Acidimicrobiales bacterium]|nr:50S ribosomal protein L10 [Acidimicrobiales bacterium]
MSEDQRAEKSSIVEDVRGRFDEADAVLITEYRGLDVGQMAELRSALREAETVYKIYKNTLVRRALDEGTPEGLIDMLVGPTALAFVGNDPGAAAKALKEFAAANEALIIKGGLLDGELLDEAQVRELADLPSRDELLSSIAGGLAAPLQQIASMMNNLLSEMANLLQALADKSGEVPEVEPVAEEAPVEEAA